MTQDHNAKTERIVLQLNKTGLSYLSNQQGTSSAFDYLKKAQKLLIAEIQVDSKNKKSQSLLAVTFNNLAIYYKRTSKPKSALTYLKKALQIEALTLQDWLATASTHLNIGAIYSFMGKHQEAVEHSNLSIQNAHKAKNTKDANNEKACSSIQLAALYNLAVSYEHLKKYQQSIQTYKRSRESAQALGRKIIQQNSQQGIDRLSNEVVKNKKKLIELLQKKRQSEERGNYESMRRNKKNFKGNQDQMGIMKNEKYSIYNNDLIEQKKRSQSVSKIVTLQPIHNSSTEGLRQVKQQSVIKKEIEKEENSGRKFSTGRMRYKKQINNKAV